MAANLADLFEHAADAFASRTAVACGDRAVTYRELEERANRLAHHLAGTGVRPGDHVGLYARNSIEATEALIAVGKLRAAAVNINYRYVENELRYMIADADLVALVHDREFGPLVAAIAPDAPALRATVVIEDGSGAGLPAGTGYATAGYDEALAGAAPERDFGPRSGDDVYVIYTGGTTGYPKGVMWRSEDIWRTLAGGIDFVTGVPMADEWEQSRRGQEGGGLVRLCAAPLIHGAAQVATLGALFGGDTVVLARRFDPDEAWRTIERHRVNLMLVIGDAMARPLIEAFKAGSYDASSLLSLSSSAALFSPAVKEACAAALPNVIITESIGATETGFTGMTYFSAGTAHRGGPTVTRGPDTIVLDDAGRPAGPGQVGRIARGGHVPLGYYKDPVKTAAMFAEVDGKRYAVPGDYARVEEDGRLTLLGRGNTCVNTGGEKVYPEEVEEALKAHPDVYDALVAGVPDERWGNHVAAVVQLREGAAEPSLDDVQAHCRARLAGYKIPRRLVITGQIQRSPSGKADYRWARSVVAPRRTPEG
jgi:acyl-CoA synthetase (AMP-forming)/AMP-acid ligase II